MGYCSRTGTALQMRPGSHRYAGRSSGATKDENVLLAAKRAAADWTSTYHIGILFCCQIENLSSLRIPITMFGPSQRCAPEGDPGVKSGAGFGRVRVALPVLFRTHSPSSDGSFAPSQPGQETAGAAGPTHQENHNQPIARKFKRGLSEACLMPAAAGAPLSQPTMLRR